MQEKEGIAKLVNLFTQAEGLNEEIKEIKDAIKDSGGNAQVAAAVARAIVKNSSEELLDKATTTIKLVEVSRN
jgi:ABC-type transport system involved in cytochrome bd biosynthesis fused ATPase/permease subunit